MSYISWRHHKVNHLTSETLLISIVGKIKSITLTTKCEANRVQFQMILGHRKSRPTIKKDVRHLKKLPSLHSGKLCQWLLRALNMNTTISPKQIESNLNKEIESNLNISRLSKPNLNY